MVRLKSRYILFELLYPESLTLPPKKAPSAKPSAAGAADPTTIQLRQPSPPTLDARRLVSLIRDTISANFGDYGAGVAGSTLIVKYLSRTTSTAIIRVSRDHFRLAWAALSYITHIGSTNVIVRVMRVSGTIKKCEQEAIRRNKVLMADVEREGKEAVGGDGSLSRFLNSGDQDVDDESDEESYE